MRKKLLFLFAAAAVFATGCDPFGTSETKAYITGRIYADSGMTEPYAGATVVVDVNPDSISIPSISCLTDAGGEFLLAVPFFPYMDGEGMSGYSYPGSGKVGLRAYAEGKEYVYRTYDESPFVVTAGDTLVVWDVSLTQFD